MFFREQTLPPELEKIRDLLYNNPSLRSLSQNTNSIEDHNHINSNASGHIHALTNGQAICSLDIQADSCHSIEKQDISPSEFLSKMQSHSNNKIQQKNAQIEIEMEEIVPQEKAQARCQTQTETQTRSQTLNEAQTQPRTSTSTNTIRSEIHSENQNQEKCLREDDDDVSIYRQSPIFSLVTKNIF